MNGPTNLPAAAKRTIQRAAAEDGRGVVLLMSFYVDPVAKPRMTQSDKWKTRKRVGAYRAYRDLIRLQAGNWRPPSGLMWLLVEVPMPKSWSKAKRASRLGKPHRQVPDRDNLDKAFLDCFGEDKRSWDGRITKLWSDRGALHVFYDKRDPDPTELYDVARSKGELK